MTLKIPFSDSARNYAVARQIAFQLPNAATMSNPTKDPLTDTFATTSSNCYIRAKIALLSTSGTQPTNRIAGMGYCDPKQNSD
ncbi:hypothetical protein [Candidatus Coxiella mudrowiae]|uniref:hypothetical protein n=1 Tax=Candidatus Coxiella mudrowiae TaxID=2054173 RepID=UPI0006620DA2|nr:hypothetical protein [Candidatus Coxiella mudrowiae]